MQHFYLIFNFFLPSFTLIIPFPTKMQTKNEDAQMLRLINLTCLYTLAGAGRFCKYACI